MQPNYLLLLSVIVVLYLFPLTAHAQSNLIDVVYLKNGSMIKGVVVEQVPNQAIKIQTSDGSLYVFEAEEIERITREEVKAQPSTSSNSSIGKPKDEWGRTFEQNKRAEKLKQKQGIALLSTGVALFLAGSGILLAGANLDKANHQRQPGFYTAGGIVGAVSLPFIVSGAGVLSRAKTYRKRAENMSRGSAMVSPALIGTQQFSGPHIHIGSAVGLTLSYQF